MNPYQTVTEEEKFEKFQIFRCTTKLLDGTLVCGFFAKEDGNLVRFKRYVRFGPSDFWEFQTIESLKKAIRGENKEVARVF